MADRGAGANGGRQDSRGFEGLAITPDGRTLYAVLQDPLVNEPGANNGRDGRNLRIVVFDNRQGSASYGQAIAQYAYQFDVYVDFAGNSVQRDLDEPTLLNGIDVGALPAGYSRRLARGAAGSGQSHRLRGKMPRE